MRLENKGASRSNTVVINWQTPVQIRRLTSLTVQICDIKTNKIPDEEHFTVRQPCVDEQQQLNVSAFEVSSFTACLHPLCIPHPFSPVLTEKLQPSSKFHPPPQSTLRYINNPTAHTSYLHFYFNRHCVYNFWIPLMPLLIFLFISQTLVGI